MKRIKHACNIGLRVGFCLLLLAWIFHKIFVNEASQSFGPNWDSLSRAEQWRAIWTIGPRELGHTLCLINPAAFGLSLLILLVLLFLNVARWRMVLKIQKLDLSLMRALNITFVAQFFNSFLLGSTGGDLIKAYYAARETHHKKTEAVVTVFVDRLIGLWTMLLFAGLMILPNWNLMMHDRVLSGAVLMIVGLLGALSIVLYLGFWGGISKRWPKARSYLRKLPMGEMFERSLDSCRQFGQHKLFLLKAVGISLLINVLVVIQYAVLAAGMKLAIPSLSLFLIVPLITCITSIPITVGGLGLRETLFVSMLPTMDATSVVSISLLAYAGNVFWSVVGGMVYMGLKNKQNLSEVTKEQAPA